MNRRIHWEGGRRSRRARMGLAAVLLTAIGGALIAVPVSAASKSSRGGTLTVVEVASNTIGIDPGGPTNSPGNAEFYPVFEPLFQPLDSGNIAPWLALKYVTSNAGKTITLTLRQGVRFSDGTPFNAQAVVFNLDRYASPAVNSECVTYFQTFVNAVAKGKYTVQINFKRPDPAFLSAISGLECGLMASPPAVTAQGANFGLHPVGTGPFTLTSYSLTGATYTARSNYWQKGYPRLNQIQFILVGSNTAAVDAVQSGEAQLYLNATPPDVVNARKIPGLITKKIPGTESPFVVGFEMADPPFNNIVAREAATYAINQTQMIDDFGSGLYEKSESFIGPGSWAFPGKTLPGFPAYNPSKAQSLLSQIPGGLSFTLLTSNTPTSEQEGAVLQAEWGAVGIHVTLNPLTGSTMIQDIHTHNFQAWIDPIGGAPVPPNDPDLIAHRWLYSTSPLNQDQINDPVMDTLLNKSVAVFNHAVRSTYYTKISEQIFKDLPWAYIFYTTAWDIESSSLKGYIPDTDYSNFWQVSV